jgi:hypothetical protein
MARLAWAQRIIVNSSINIEVEWRFRLVVLLSEQILAVLEVV